MVRTVRIKKHLGGRVVSALDHKIPGKDPATGGIPLALACMALFCTGIALDKVRFFQPKSIFRFRISR